MAPEGHPGALVERLHLDDFFTFMAGRTDAFDEVDEFQAIRFHVRAELAERVFEQCSRQHVGHVG
jgi:hypothetical protein